MLDSCKGRISALDRAQNRTAQFTKLSKVSDWENVAQLRRQDSYAHILKRTLGNRYGELYETGC